MMGASDGRQETFPSTEELALYRIGGELPSSLPQDRYGTVEGDQRARLQRQIDDAMKGAIQDAFHRPNPITGDPRSATVTVGGAAPARSGPVGNGWRDPGPLRPVATPLAEAIIEAMAHQALPHGSANTAFRGPKPKEE
jgi:hypothetical protein